MRSNFNKFSILCYFIFICFAACQPTVRFASNKSEEKKSSIAEQNSGKKSTIAQSSTKKNPQSNTSTSHIANNFSNKILTIAESWLGVSYKYAGNTKAGVDCSGFVKNVYNEVGVELPRTSGEQYLVTIPTDQPNVGDLVFFKKRDQIYHVGIYVGNNQMIHASSQKGVIKQSLDENVFVRNHAGFGKIKIP